MRTEPPSINRRALLLGGTGIVLAAATAMRINSKPSSSFSVEVVSSVALGQGLASNSINTAVFRHNGIISQGDWQYTAFYLDANTLRVIKRQISSGGVTSHDLKGHYGVRDAHNIASIGHDRDGFLHLSYDQHASPLRYRRSTLPHDITQWDFEAPLTGKFEASSTYPAFILPRKSHPLTLLYRDGNSLNGVIRLKDYDETTREWRDHPIPILAGADPVNSPHCPYLNNPVVGPDGALHLSFVWRIPSETTKATVNNVDIGYARSPDNGKTWQNAAGQLLPSPLTPSAATVFPVAPGSNLMNQCSMALDSKGRPHVAFYANDNSGIPQYHHLWFDGASWLCQAIAKRTRAFNLTGVGTLSLPICRPVMLMDKSDNCFVLIQGDLTQHRLAAIKLSAAEGYAYTPENQVILWPEHLGNAEPVIDRGRWELENVLSVFIQKTAQTGVMPHPSRLTPVSLVDFKFH